MRRKSRWLREWEAIYRDVHDDVFAWCDLLRLNPTFYQDAVLQAVQEGHTQIAVVSGQGPGKTKLVTAAASWRTFRNYKAMTVLTAPSLRQCKDVFLAEMQRTLDQANPILQKFIKVTKSKVNFGGVRDWDIKIATATDAANIAGYHEDNMTFILEEAQGIPHPIIETIEGTLTNLNCMCIAIGNPTTRNCSFAGFFNDEAWNQHRFNTEHDAPILATSEDPVHRELGEGLVARNERLLRKYGRDSDVYRVRVLGNFPSQDPNCVISADDLWECTKTDPVKAAMAERDSKGFGTDLAAFGGDESVIYRRHGYAILDQWISQEVDPKDVVKQAFRMQACCGWRNRDCVHVFDIGGLGAGVRHLYYDRDGCRFFGFAHNAVPKDPKEYADRITEAFFLVAELARQRKIHIPRDPMLIKQLSSRQYDLDTKSRIKVESKKQYRQRMAREGQGAESPDRADALVMAFYSLVVQTEGKVARRVGGRKAVGTGGKR